MLTFTLYFGPPGNIYKQVSVGRRVLEFWDLHIDIFLEVQEKKYSLSLCLIYYIAYGLRIWYEI